MFWSKFCCHKFCRQRTAGGLAALVVIPGVILCYVPGPIALLAQSTPVAPSSTTALEFPVFMRQNVEAGKTPVGTKVQAKLSVATLVNGVVIPEGAILSGEVIESEAKSATEPSRLAIRMDSAHWKPQPKTKNASTPTVLALPSKVYLTAWFYPMAKVTNESILDASQGDPMDTSPSPRRRSQPAALPIPSSSPTSPYPGRGRGSNTNTAPDLAPDSSATQHRVAMKDVESTRSSDGAVTLTSKRSNLKLDKSTTYVLATGDLGTGTSSRVP